MFGVLGVWDIVLLAVVTLHATVHAYVPNAQLKAFIYLLPFPFTAAALAVGRPIDSTNIWSLLLLLIYLHGVRLLHVNARVPIQIAIALSLFTCAVLGVVLGPALATLQHNYSLPLVFWCSFVGVCLFSFLLSRLMPVREEPAQRTPAPLWIKLPTISLIVLGLIIIKKPLAGLITAFPMVGVVAAYEARYSLWTMSRQVTALMPALATMIVAVHWAQSAWGWALPAAIALGWVVFLPLIFLCTPILRERVVTRVKGSMSCAVEGSTS